MHGGGGDKATSVTKIFGNIFISFVGAGVLGLPYAFKESGILEGLIVMGFIAYWSVQAMLLLIDCKYRCIDMVNKDNFSLQKPLLRSDSPSNSDDRPVRKRGRPNHDDEISASISYGKVGSMAFGRWGQNLVDAAIVISQIGFCCAYLIFISENISYYIAGCNGDDAFEGNPGDFENISKSTLEVETTNIDDFPDESTVTVKASLGDMIHNLTKRALDALDSENLDSIVSQDPSMTEFEQCELNAKTYGTRIVIISLLPLLLLCQIRHLNKLAIFSLMADFANVFAYLIVFWFDFEHVTKVKVHPKEMDFSGLPFFLSVSMYCYEGAGMILALEESVHADHRPRFRLIFNGAMTAITMLYVIFGVSGYLSFGEDTQSIITLNLPGGIFPGMVKSCLCFSLFFTFPIMMFPVVETIERRFKIYRALKNSIVVSVKDTGATQLNNFSTLFILAIISKAQLSDLSVQLLLHLSSF